MFAEILTTTLNEIIDLLRSKNGVFSDPYSVQIQENTDKKKLRIWTLLAQ